MDTDEHRWRQEIVPGSGCGSEVQSSKFKAQAELFFGVDLKTGSGGLKGVLLGGENKEVAGEGLVREVWTGG
jgi:hypothetical protein